MTRILKILRIQPSGSKPTDSDSLSTDPLSSTPTEYIDCADAGSAVELLSTNQYDGVFLPASHDSDGNSEILELFRNQQILDGMPDGVVLVDRETRVHWANQCFRNWCKTDNPVGLRFRELFERVEYIGPEFGPHQAIPGDQPFRTTIKVPPGRFFQIHASPISPAQSDCKFQIVSMRDVTEEKVQAHKLEAIHRAGLELADLKPDEVSEMGLEDRIDLLKSNIIHYTRDLLNFTVIEIRLIEKPTNRLKTLLSVGINSEASKQELFAEVDNNGVTGFVASTGQSYLCEDTDKDPLYIEGLEGARSCLTVPLVLHEEVIGTFNVESDQPNSFTESDLQLLKIFSRDVANALNTLHLLAAENANVSNQNTEAIVSAVGGPIDHILNQAVSVMDNFIGHSPEVKEQLRDVMNNALKIKQIIKEVGAQMQAPAAQAAPISPPNLSLQGRHILVIDDDESVRSDAHRILEKQGCIVETAYRGTQALLILQNCNEKYDVIISDLRLSDLKGYDFLMKLKDIMANPPLILMTGFGWDPGHQMVKARQAGMPAEAFLYKPFRKDQLISTVKFIIENFPTS